MERYNKLLSEYGGNKIVTLHYIFFDSDDPLLFFLWNNSDIFDDREQVEYMKKANTFYNVLCNLCSCANVPMKNIHNIRNPYTKPFIGILSIIALCIICTVFITETLTGTVGKAVSDVLFKFIPILISCSLTPIAAKIFPKFFRVLTAQRLTRNLRKNKIPFLCCVRAEGIFGILILIGGAITLFCGGKDAYVLSVMYLLLGGSLMIVEHIMIYDDTKGIFKSCFRVCVDDRLFYTGDLRKQSDRYIGDVYGIFCIMCTCQSYSVKEKGIKIPDKGFKTLLPGRFFICTYSVYCLCGNNVYSCSAYILNNNIAGLYGSCNGCFVYYLHKFEDTLLGKLGCGFYRKHGITVGKLYYTCDGTLGAQHLICSECYTVLTGISCNGKYLSVLIFHTKRTAHGAVCAYKFSYHFYALLNSL